MVKYFKEMNESQQSSITNTLVRAENDLRTIYLGCTERLIKSLFLINGGGVIALLAYIYKNEIQLSIIKKYLFSVALITFLIGLCFTFILVICDFLFVFKKHNILRAEIFDFFDNKILVNRFSVFKRPNQKSNQLIYIVGVLSCLCVCFGIIVGLCGYFSI